MKKMKVDIHVSARIIVLMALSMAAARSMSPSNPGPDTKTLRYSNASYHWSVSYPKGWKIDDRDPSYVRISYKNTGLCGIQTSSLRFETLDLFTDFMLDGTAQKLLDKGLFSVTASRKRISLPNGQVGNDVLVDLVPGGRSRRVFVLTHGQGFIIDCEADWRDWKKVESSYDLIVTSFTLGE